MKYVYGGLVLFMAFAAALNVGMESYEHNNENSAAATVIETRSLTPAFVKKAYGDECFPTLITPHGQEFPVITKKAFNARGLQCDKNAVDTSGIEIGVTQTFSLSGGNKVPGWLLPIMNGEEYFMIEGAPFILLEEDQPQEDSPEVVTP